MVHYGVTKTGQFSLSRGLAETTKGTGVTVNAVAPGPTMTEGQRDLAKEKSWTPEDFEREYFKDSSSLLMRCLTEDEVAAPILYLASPASSGTNGSILRVDGGTYRAVI